MALPSREAFSQSVLEIFDEAEEILAVKQIYERLPSRMSLSEEDLAEKYPSGYEIFPVMVRVAISGLVEGGLVKQIKRAHYQITEAGIQRMQGRRQPTPTVPGPTETLAGTRTGSGGAYDLPSDPGDLGLGDLGPGQLMAAVSDRLDQDLMEKMQDKLRTMPWRAFEFLVLDLLERVGYGRPEHTGRVGDEGIDGIIHQDPLGLEKVYMQAKRWNQAVVRLPVVQQFNSDLAAKGATKGVLFTSSGFHSDAREYAQEVSDKSIILIDGREMARMMIDYGVGVVTEVTYTVKELDENYFDSL